MRARYTRFLAAPRFYALVTGWISGLGLVLAIVGVVGLSLVATARRTAEFGVRLALGAVPRHIVRLVLTQAAVLVGGGIVIGLVAVRLAAQVLRGLVAGVSPTDVPSALGSTTALAVLALLGCAWPARRALRVTPAEALRVD
jgi:putative ABC transport system permease protein